MQIIVDGLPKQVPDGATVGEVLRLLGEPIGSILVEVNGIYLRPGDYDRRALAPGDRLEVILPATGG